MDIRIINNENEVINATTLTLRARNVFLVGVTVSENPKEVLIERFKTKEEAIYCLKGIIEGIKMASDVQSDSIVIDLKENKEQSCDGKCENCKKEHQDTNGTE